MQISAKIFTKCNHVQKTAVIFGAALKKYKPPETAADV